MCVICQFVIGKKTSSVKSACQIHRLSVFKSTSLVLRRVTSPWINNTSATVPRSRMLKCGFTHFGTSLTMADYAWAWIAMNANETPQIIRLMVIWVTRRPKNASIRAQVASQWRLPRRPPVTQQPHEHVLFGARHPLGAAVVPVAYLNKTQASASRCCKKCDQKGWATHVVDNRFALLPPNNAQCFAYVRLWVERFNFSLLSIEGTLFCSYIGYLILTASWKNWKLQVIYLDRTHTDLYYYFHFTLYSKFDFSKLLYFV